MNSIRLFFTALALFFWGGAVRADDRLWDMYKEVCIDTKLDSAKYTEILSKKWNIKPKIVKDDGIPEEFIRFFKDLPLGSVMFDFRYVDPKEKVRLLHCSMFVKVKDQKNYEALYDAFFKEGRITVDPKDKLAMKNKVNEKAFSVIFPDEAKYNLDAFKSRVKASDMSGMPANSMMFILHKIYAPRN